MTSERVQRQIERLLDEAEAAAAERSWDVVKERAEHALTFDPENADARALLIAAERGLSTMNAPDARAAPATSATAAAQPDSFADGRYAVKRFLGEGGKKKVYLAHDARLDRDVAFALIKTEGLDEAARERITREAQAMGRLGTHPNIVTVYDIGEENGQPFLVLPVLEGGDVEGLIEKAPEHKLPIDEVIRVGVDTCEGLEFLHAKGLVHRDVKPGNTWLTREGRAMIGDFGLAVAVDRSRLTQAGMMVGTVSYMAPEQAMGGEVTPRADLYALGAMLYEMVCGRPPFVGDESVAIIGQHLNTPPVAPTWHRPECPPALEALILRLLEKDPQKRPASAAEVGDALKAAGQSGSKSNTQALSRAEPAPGADPLYRTVFVGREAELKQLQSAFDAAMSGQGGLVMVVGEPGIGKTAICQQLATYVSLRGGRTLVGHCYEEGSLSLPYLAFVEAMRTYVLARDPDGLKSDLGSGAADVARIVSEVRDRVAVELRDAGDPEDDRWRLLQSVTTFLRNAASVQPLVIVLEDLHWADRGTLDLLQHVARNLQGVRLVVVGTYRDVEVDRAHPLSSAVAELRRSGTFLRVPLRGLTVDEVHRMYEALRGNEVPWAQAENVHRQTEGNPLFVQEVLRFLVEEGIVVREGGRYVAQTPGEGVPEGLRDVIGRRLSHLDDKTNTVLSIASVIGRDFRLDVLQEVAGLSEDDLYAALEEASERAIVEQVPSPTGVAFRFTHAMFRTLLYDEIFAPRRIRLHQQVGRALEEIHARRLEEHAAELAEHFSQSTEAADLEKAVRYGELAARRAMGVFAYGEAVRHLDQALRAQEVLDPKDDLRISDLQIVLGEALLALGDRSRLIDEVAPALLSRAQKLEDDERAWAACRLVIEVAAGVQTGELTRWQDIAERYVANNPRARVRLLRSKAATEQQLLHRKEATRLVREGLDLARTVGDADSEFGMVFIALAFGVLPTEEERVLLDEYRDRSPSSINSLTLTFFLGGLSGASLAWGDREKAEALSDELKLLAGRTHHNRTLAMAEAVDQAMSAMNGDLDGAIERTSRVVMGGAGAALGSWIRPLLYRGEFEQALESFNLLPPGTDGHPLLRATRACCLAGAGRLEPAREIHRELTEQFPAGTEEDFTDITIGPFLELALLVDDTVTAERLYLALIGRSKGRRYITQGGFCLPHLIGNAAAALGRFDEAREHYEEALAFSQKIRHRPEIALTRLDLAELLLKHYPDEREAAIEHLDFAISEFREMKMQPALERALRHRGLLKA